MKLKLDLHDIHSKGAEIDRALRAIIDEAVAKKAPLVEIIPGKGSGALKKHVLRFLDQTAPLRLPSEAGSVAYQKGAPGMSINNEGELSVPNNEGEPSVPDQMGAE